MNTEVFLDITLSRGAPISRRLHHQGHAAPKDTWNGGECLL